MRFGNPALFLSVEVDLIEACTQQGMPPFGQRPTASGRRGKALSDQFKRRSVSSISTCKLLKTVTSVPVVAIFTKRDARYTMVLNAASKDNAFGFEFAEMEKAAADAEHGVDQCIEEIRGLLNGGSPRPADYIAAPGTRLALPAQQTLIPAQICRNRTRRAISFAMP